MTFLVGDVHIADYQHNRSPEVWSGALWMGGLLNVLEAVATSHIELVVDEEDVVANARYWIERIPVEVKAKWPGTFVEYPYDGESAEDHAQRIEWHKESREQAR